MGDSGFKPWRYRGDLLTRNKPGMPPRILGGILGKTTHHQRIRRLFGGGQKFGMQCFRLGEVSVKQLQPEEGHHSPMCFYPLWQCRRLHHACYTSTCVFTRSFRATIHGPLHQEADAEMGRRRTFRLWRRWHRCLWGIAPSRDRGVCGVAGSWRRSSTSRSQAACCERRRQGCCRGGACRRRKEGHEEQEGFGRRGQSKVESTFGLGQGEDAGPWASNTRWWRHRAGSLRGHPLGGVFFARLFCLRTGRGWGSCEGRTSSSTSRKTRRRYARCQDGKTRKRRDEKAETPRESMETTPKCWR